MTSVEAFLQLVAPESMTLYEGLLAEPEGSALPGWAGVQDRFLKALDAYVDAELARPADFEIQSHEAGGQCRVWFPHYRVRGDGRMLDRMRAILDARLTWGAEYLHHGYVDCHEVHHEPETFLYFQSPLMHLTGDGKAVAAVEDFAHHVGNWADNAPDWYDWETHGFRSTWLGTREIRAFPPYDYQEANHFRFVAIGLAAYLATGKGRYLELGEDYAARWCDHIEARAHEGLPVECSILPAGARRQEMGYGGRIKEAVQDGVYPIFYATVAQNTAYDIVVVLLDLYRLTGKDRYRAAAEAMVAQFYDHIDSEGRPPSQFSNGEWKYGHAGDEPKDGLRAALSGSNDLLVRMAEAYRAVTGETRFDGPLLQWASSVDEYQNPFDQLPISLMVAAHRMSGEARYLERAYSMALRGLAVTETNTMWHQCDSSGRYGFKYPADVVYHPILAGVDYATRGGLPIIGLAYETGGQPGLPSGVNVRTWEPDPGTLCLEAVNGGESPAEWRVSASGTSGKLTALQQVAGEGDLAVDGDGWQVALSPGGRIQVQGKWVDRNVLSV